MVKEEANTKMNKLKSSKTSSALFSGAKIKIEDKYKARIIIGML
jgi:hypothetical protein